MVLLDIQPPPHRLKRDQVIHPQHLLLPVLPPPFVLQPPNVPRLDTQDGEVEVRPRRAVVPLDQHAQDVQLANHLLALQDTPQRRQAALGEHHAAHPRVALPPHRVREHHVELDEEHGGEEEVLVGPDVLAHHRSAPLVVGDVHDEPDFLDRDARALGQPEPFGRETGDDLIDDAFTEEDEAEVAETGHRASKVLRSLERTPGWVPYAQVTVIREYKDFGGFSCFSAGSAPNHSCEAAVHEGVEVSADGVKGNEVFDLEMLGDLKYELGIIEEGGENAELIEVKLVWWRIR